MYNKYWFKRCPEQLIFPIVCLEFPLESNCCFFYCLARLFNNILKVPHSLSILRYHAIYIIIIITYVFEMYMYVWTFIFKTTFLDYLALMPISVL